MMPAFSRALMALACRCLGEGRREWAQAMRAEFDAVVEDGRPLPFAIGCLFGALRQMPMQEEGRFILTNYTLALGIMMPMAALQVGCAVFGLPYLFPGTEGLRGTMIPAQELLFGGAYRAAVPSLTILLLLSGGGQLRVAWLMLERDWSRVTSTGMAILATIATLILFMGTLFLDTSQVVTQGAVLAVELVVLAGLSRWHAELTPPPPERSSG
ncbi:hypothetical protein ABIC65_004445 [Sphingomonas trueperi]|uniref:hypothetical protein n=1 Tax=Sphingomonas trueperi TaxID=53317 RepID=UPI003399FE93